MWARWAVAGVALAVLLAGCSSGGGDDTTVAGVDPGDQVELDSDTRGVIDETDNIVNTSIVSKNDNVFQAEYEAGYLQGKLQGDTITAARDNSWDGSYLTDPDHTYPKQLPPSQAELDLAQRTLQANWDYMLRYISDTAEGDVQQNLRRMMYRLVGIYDGATKPDPQSLPFTAEWTPTFDSEEMQVTYETPAITFMDLYYLNATGDLFDFLPDHGVPASSSPTSKCTAFVKVTDDDIYLTHNTWNAFLDQSQALNLMINEDYMSTNLLDPGYLGSGTDFGYTNHGLIWNETTEDSTTTKPKIESVWTFWRETLAEQYAKSIDDFFRYVTIEQSGSYMNGYMIVDTKSDELGYVEMSYDTAVFFRPNADGVDVTTKPAGLSTAYDKKMVRPDYILGFNYPASKLIRKQIKAINNRPAREVQLLAGIGDVTDIESAKSLITYTAPDNPLSIYGRWDLGYGETTTPQTVPDGSVDAKAVSASTVRAAADVTGELEPEAGTTAFWMKFGTASVNGEPFIWSQSQWSDQKLRDVPDRVAGDWQLLNSGIN